MYKMKQTTVVCAVEGQTAFSDFFFSSRRRHTRWNCDWSSDVCSSDLEFHVRLQEMLDDVKLLASRNVGIDRQHVGGASALRLEREETLVAPYVEDGFPSQVLGKLNSPQPFRSEERRVGKEWRAGVAGV